jgi:hypothetical protein
MLSIDLNQTDEVSYLYNDGTSLRLASSQLASELSFSTAVVSSIQVTDTTQRTGQSFSLSYGLPLSLSGSMSVSQIETVVFGSELTVSGASGLSVTESQSIQVRAPLSTTGDPIVFGARNGITITHPVISDGGNQTLDADKDADGVGTLSLDFPVYQFTDPNPNSGNGFGTSVLVLPSGNVAITSPNDDFGGSDAGAVYLFNGMTGSLISSLRGSSASDQVGITGLVQLTNGNYVVRSTLWDSGTVADVGAVTWGNGTSGISGAVSSSNSIVGQTANQGVSWSLTTASNLDAFLATNPSDGSGRVVLGSSARGFSLPSTPAGSLQAANGSVSLSVAETNLQGTISSNANVSIAPSQAARQIDLGSKPSGILGLTETELDWIAAANLRIGNSTSGDLTISSPISRPTSTAMQLTSGGAILLGSGAQSTNGAIHTAGGTLSLDAGTTIRPVTPGVDANTSAFSFAAGDTLQMDINGATVDSLNSVDQNAVSAASGTSNPQFDLNGDGIVNSTDVLMVRRALGRRLASGLVVDD